MGNCCKTTSSMEWGGENWSSLTPKKNKRKKSSRKVFDELKLNKEKLLVRDLSASYNSDHSNGKIKIKITKRELEVLLGEIEKPKQQGKVISAEQMLVRLMKAREHHHTDDHRPWSPALESIPEVN